MTSLEYLKSLLKPFSTDIKSGAGKGIDEWIASSVTGNKAFYISWNSYSFEGLYSNGDYMSVIESITIFMKSPKSLMINGRYLDIVEQIDEIVERIYLNNEFKKNNKVNTIEINSVNAINSGLTEIVEFELTIYGS